MVGTYDNGEARAEIYDEDSAFTPEPEKATRVAIDEQVLESEDIRGIVIRPTLIYGRGIGVSGISVQLPKLIDVAKKHGVPRHVGRGLNIWGHVHIADVVDLFLLALDKAEAGSLFYAEAGEANSSQSRSRSAPHARHGRCDQGLADGEAVEGWGPARISPSARTARVRGVSRARWGGCRKAARWRMR